MKTIIYAGISLFSVATVYGIADYYTANKNGSIDNLYKEKPIVAAALNNKTTPVINDETALHTNTANENTAGEAIKSSSKNKKTIRLRSFSRAIIVEEPGQEEILKSAETTKGLIKKAEPATGTQSKKPDSTKINLDMFSRAPLRPVFKKGRNKQ